MNNKNLIFRLDFLNRTFFEDKIFYLNCKSVIDLLGPMESQVDVYIIIVRQAREKPPSIVVQGGFRRVIYTL